LSKSRAIPRWLVVAFLAAMLAILAIGAWFYRGQREHLETQAEQNLSSIAELKVWQIVKWRRDHLAVASILGEGPFIYQAVREWIEKSDESVAKDLVDRFRSYQKYQGYGEIMLADTNGKVRLSLSGTAVALTAEESDHVVRATTERRPSLCDLYREPGGKAVRLSLVAPVCDEADRSKPVLGVFVLRINAAQFLFPLVESWPVPSETAETLLVRRDGDSVLFINNLRHRGNAAMKLRVPLTKTNVPAVAAVLGRTGVMDGVDYRGVEVFAVLKSIPDTSWFMVSKVDRSEALAAWRLRSLLIAGLILGLLLGVTGLAAAVWQRETKRNVVSLFEAEVGRRESEARYYTTLMSVGDGVIVTDVQGRLELMNEAAEEMTGWRLQDARGKPLAEVFSIVNENTRRPVESPVARVLRDNRVVGLANHTLLISRDGTERPIADSGAPVRNDTGQTIGVVLVFSDQTNQRRAETEIKNLALRMEAVLAAVPDIVMEVDVNKIYTWANPAGYAFFGDDCIGKEAAHYFEGEQETYHRVESLFKGDPNIFYVESWQRRRDGEKRLLAWWCRVTKDPSGQVKGALSTARDITEARRHEEMVAEEKERLSVTLHSIGDAVICTDTEGRVTLLNRAAEQLTGWSQTEAVGQPLEKVFRIFDERTNEPCENPVQKVLKTGETVHLSNHTKLVSRNGRTMSIADSGAPINDAEGNTIGTVLVFRDTTEKQKLIASMQLASKLESVGLLAGGIAHDFNNLLSGIFGYIDVAQVCLKEKQLGETAEALTRALSVFDRARALTGQLLTFSKGGQPVRKRIELAPLIERNVRFALSGSNVACRLEGLGGLWACECDEGQIGQVLDSIVINAQQAMPAGGVVTVSARNLGPDDARPPALESGQDYVEIEIRDIGIGIAADVLPRIFEPFFTTKAMGHGLGLSTCYFIVKQHGGHIDAESEPGKGTVVRVYLPAVKTEGTASVTVSDAVPAHHGEGKVLVMDDEPYIRNILRRMLTTMGYTVTVVKEGSEALREFERARKSGAPFSALILDLIIPGGMGGVETVARIRQLDTDVPIVAISGYSSDPVMSDPLAHGFTDRVAKPFRMQDIAGILSKVLKGRDGAA
jgi:PAS domain S-box-containing protein